MTTHRLNHTGNVAIDTRRKYSKIDKNTPRGVKLILVTTERVAVFGVLTEANRRHFTHWEPLAQIPGNEPGPPLVIRPCPDLLGTGNKMELRGGKTQYIKQYEAEKMTNEELQTLIKNACKAAGWQIKKTLHPSVVSVWINGAPYVVKLADDDGDSRMLQVACRIALGFYDDVAAASHDDAHVFAHEPLQDDDNKAARMAVLRCAALIGEAME